MRGGPWRATSRSDRNPGSGTGAAGRVRGACVLWEHVTTPERPALQTPRPRTPPVGLTTAAIQTLGAVELLSGKQICCDRITMKLAITT